MCQMNANGVRERFYDEIVAAQGTLDAPQPPAQKAGRAAMLPVVQ
jgi:hypothetical protein